MILGLNEGFASWIEYLAVDKCYPEFDIWTQFVADTFARFLVPDALKSSHPIEVPIGNLSSSSNLFLPIFPHQVIRRKSTRFSMIFPTPKVHQLFACYTITSAMMLFEKVFTIISKNTVTKTR